MDAFVNHRAYMKNVFNLNKPEKIFTEKEEKKDLPSPQLLPGVKDRRRKLAKGRETEGDKGTH